ncbi:MAG: hypothetical protein JW788_05870, partial [Candidatus Omnitrophica bacterium]|nr:hypothetical protein [Candidatus Omnitrophota bacterium]
MSDKSRFLIWSIIFIFSFFPSLNAQHAGAIFTDPYVTISMDFQDAGLKDVLKIFSIQSGLNFIASEAVQDRRMTLYLDKVPLKEAMDKLFRANNLSYELREDENIFIVKDWGTPQIETMTKVFTLKYQRIPSSSIKRELVKSLETGEIGDIVTSIKDILSPNGKLTEDASTNSLIITDIPSRFPVIEKVIEKLDVPIPQVLIDVEILDVSKDTVDKLGFNFGDNPLTLVLPGHWHNKGFNFFMGNASYKSKKTIDSTTGNSGFASIGSHYGALLDFLRTQTTTKYLARPRIMTLSNEPAEISITKDETVGQKPVLTTTTDENGNVHTSVTSWEFIRATSLTLTEEGIGVFLRVTPQVNLETDEITMMINPKSSTTSINTSFTFEDYVNSDPEVKSTKSIIKVKDGETVILGGLIHTDKMVERSKLPILGDIPLLGAFFRKKDQTKSLERELLVFITPHIIKDDNTQFAQIKKVRIPQREQSIGQMINRKATINSSLDS